MAYKFGTNIEPEWVMEAYFFWVRYIGFVPFILTLFLFFQNKLHLCGVTVPNFSQETAGLRIYVFSIEESVHFP